MQSSDDIKQVIAKFAMTFVLPGGVEGLAGHRRV